MTGVGDPGGGKPGSAAHAADVVVFDRQDQASLVAVGAARATKLAKLGRSRRQADATAHELMGDTVFCTSIAGEEIGRILTWGTHPIRQGDYRVASPCLPVDIPQTYLEPILVRNATERGTQTRFSTEYLSHRQDADGVDVLVRDRLTGQEYTIRAKYLIGADGARSKVAANIGLPMQGAMDIAGSMNIVLAPA